MTFELPFRTNILSNVQEQTVDRINQEIHISLVNFVDKK